MYIVSKLWCNEQAPEDVEAACQQSIEDLGLDYLDDFMLHWPVQFTKDSKLVCNEYGGKFDYKIVHSGDLDKVLDTWKAMEKLVESGLTRNISASNMGIKGLRHLISNASIKPFSLQVELHPYLAQNNLVKFCHEENIQIIAYSPLGKIGYRNAGDPSILEDKVIKQIAEEVNKSAAQVILKWNVQRNVCVIPKSLNASRMV